MIELAVKHKNKYMDMPIECPRSYAKSKLIYDRIYKDHIKPGFTCTDVFGASIDRDPFMERSLPKVME